MGRAGCLCGCLTEDECRYTTTRFADPGPVVHVVHVVHHHQPPSDLIDAEVIEDDCTGCGTNPTGCRLCGYRGQLLPAGGGPSASASGRGSAWTIRATIAPSAPANNPGAKGANGGANELRPDAQEPACAVCGQVPDDATGLGARGLCIDCELVS